MHLLHVVRSVAPSHGGVAEAVIQFVKAHPQVGDTAEVVCQDEPTASFLADFPCPIHALGAGSLGTFGLSARLWRWLDENASRFDGIIMNGVWSFANLAVRSAANRKSVSYVIFPHGSLDPWFNRRYKLKYAKKLAYWPLQFAVLRDAAAVLFTSDTERDLATTSFRPNHWKSIVVPFGISAPEGDPVVQSNAFYAQAPALRSRRYLLCLARICEKKGCDILIQAFAKYSRAESAVDLVIAGPDEAGLQAKLEALTERLEIADRVHWPGILTGPAKWGALRCSEALILPSHQENFGIVVVESLAAGRPTLISNQVNIWREIEAGGAGLVDDDTLAGTERLLRGWFSLPCDERDAMSTRAYSCFSRCFSMKLAAEALRSLFGASRSDVNIKNGLAKVTMIK